MILVKSRRRPVLQWLVRALAAAVLFAAALWMVYSATSYPADPAAPVFAIVGSAVLIAGLAAEEFVGADIRRILRM
ncbi:MAG TPA: hypothetical protein VGG89_15320 [Candidatus Baltobacteraceae bacterium]|jgi:peptidoglycan/LPS O-acetylase OafA/YrhL